ncbi:hypothetical protein [Leptolyngbya sp. FACHB-16]|uniref:hypothetical protein n=1 Tax=unclassified Leptolyngbya TaxID=2650499 RepID=UPI001688CA9B|nr:hypothetical protein [Leptolyngbya sp. FACHB-16]MBD2156290.1 hypothetical protein [Leptolyngbya sp. FACHB-16]
MTLRGLFSYVRCWLFGHEIEFYRRGRSWQSRCVHCHDPNNYTLGDRLQQLRQWRPKLLRWGRSSGSDEMPF